MRVGANVSPRIAYVESPGARDTPADTSPRVRPVDLVRQLRAASLRTPVAAVEPVFGNLRANKRLDRFTLRGRMKVDAQWKLYCLVHKIEKLAHHRYAAPVAT